MEVLWIVGAGLASILAGLSLRTTWRNAGRGRLFADALAAVASDRGWKHEPMAKRVSGTVDGFEVTLEGRADPSGSRLSKQSQVLFLRISGGRPAPVQLSAKSDAGEPSTRGRPDLTTGDPVFDARVRVTGHPADGILRQWLDAGTRQRILEAVALGVVYRHAEWTYTRGMMTDPVAIGALLDRVLAAALALARERTPGDLRRIVTDDPVPAVRVAVLRDLLARGEADADWLEQLATSAGPTVASCAAAALGESGRGVLSGLLSDPDVGRDAALALVRLGPGDARDAVENVLLRACLATAEPPVIDALAAIGSVRALPVLRELAAEGLGLTEVARRARAAVTAIDARVGARAGGLSLAGAVGGELSEGTTDPERSELR